MLPATLAVPTTAPTDPSVSTSTSVHTRLRRTPVKPTPSGSSFGSTNGQTQPRAVLSESKRAKPTLTSSMNFPGLVPETATSLAVKDGESGRTARRSKVEAISKIDRAGTPLQLNAGPSATSFIPAAPATTAPISGPSVARNPLHRPQVVNPPFSIETVRTSAPRHPPTRAGTRLFGLEECPTYYPTAEQWTDCMAYIDSIAPEAKAYGICKIVPPEGWRMPFVLETDKFRFKTRLQRLNSLEAASRAKINFLEQLKLYLEQGDSKLTIPYIDRRPVDLYQLRKAVMKIGGHEEVNRMGGWGIIAKTLGYDERYAISVKGTYMRIILPFDTFANGGKSASGSPLTPMPSTAASRPPGFVNESPSSPTRKTGRMGAVRPPAFAGRAQAARSPSPPVKPFQLQPGPVKDLPATDVPSRPNSTASSSTMLKIKVPGFSKGDGSESELSDESPPPKKIKLVANAPYQKGEVCEVCSRGDDAPKILLCDSCDKGFHIYCLNPPLSFVPTNEEWYCGPCLFAQGDGYGFDEGEDHSIASFQARDAAFAKHWFSKHPMNSESSGTTRKFGASTVSEDDVEREFWRLTQDPTETVEIEYGADVHSTTHGSGSPSLETHPMNPYAKDGWNLNNMPILSESLLRYIRSDISGMTVPWIYVGMMLSAFCWHNEDHYTYSVNYMHWGETKTWYGIPGSDAEKFEEAMKSEAPELFEQQPSLLYQLVTMMNPGRVSEAGVKVVACDQRPNEFVITFPKAYHCGFNHGINFNEAVNFALPDWLAEGKEAVLRYKMHAKAPVFSHNELLINITLYSETIRTALWLQDQLKEMVDEETTRRERLRSQVPLLTEHLVEEDLPEEQYQCCICKGFCYLSQITCSCTKLVACVEHGDHLCSCAKAKRTLRKRYSEAQLEEIYEIVHNRAAQPRNWRTRLDNLLEQARPPLKSMRALLHEGERIPYSIPEVQDLRALVDRANAWIDKVTTLLTRKSAGRKKRRQTGPEEDTDRSPSTLQALLAEANKLAFESPEILSLRQILLSIESFKSEAESIMATADDALELEKCKTALILGQSLNIDLPEIATLQTIVNRLEWFKKVEEEVDDRALQYEDVLELLREAEECEIPASHPTIVELNKREAAGREWQDQVKNLLSSSSIQIEDVTGIIEGKELIPTSIAKMRELEGIRKQALTWQATAQTQFEGNGTSNAAIRLCKAVNTASGPLSRINIPEVTRLQNELDFHETWQRDVASVLRVPPKTVSATLNRLLQTFQQHFQPEDEVPSAEITCFCRTAPISTMVTCQSCHGTYHPRCVEVSAKNVDKPFTCAMCEHIASDDRPSLNELSQFASFGRYRFLIVPTDFDTLVKIIDIAVGSARSLLTIVDPLGQAIICRNFDLIAHWHRKLFNLPITFDAQNARTSKRVIFEEWLYKRMMDAKNPPKARTRPRKPKLVLRQAKEGTFGCLCTTPPVDALVTVTCVKCAQGYHATCVRAPAECLGVERKNWRCPCCTVKEAKRIQQGDVLIRVQNTDRLGTDIYIDYRTTINTYAPQILEYTLAPADAIVLECLDFVPPIIPIDFKPPTIEEVRATRFEDNNDDLEDGRKTKRRKPNPEVHNDSRVMNGVNGTGSNGLAHSTAPNGHSQNMGSSVADPASMGAVRPPYVHPQPTNGRPQHTSVGIHAMPPSMSYAGRFQQPSPSVSGFYRPSPSNAQSSPSPAHAIGQSAQVNRPMPPPSPIFSSTAHGPLSSSTDVWRGLGYLGSRLDLPKQVEQTRSDPVQVPSDAESVIKNGPVRADPSAIAAERPLTATAEGMVRVDFMGVAPNQAMGVMPRMTPT